MFAVRSHAGWAASSTRRPCALFAAGALALSLAGCVPGGGQTDTAALGGAAGDGALLYGRYCAPCHGVNGDGAGPAAYLLFPKPRNFQRGEFKLRSTPQGQPPRSEDLVRTVREGIPGTSMLGFDGLLSDEQITAVVEHVRSLSPVLQGRQEPAPAVAIPEVPEPSARLVALGRGVYERFRCAQCHGVAGRGDGPAAPSLRDSEGDPFPAADFTDGVYKSGRDPASLYRTLMTGMAGTPMPAFAEAFADEQEAWGLVYYLLSLAADPPPARYAADPVTVVPIAGDALEDPWAEAWQQLPAHRKRLHPLWARPGVTPYVTVRAGYHEGRLALMLEWRDDTYDAESLRQVGFADAVALQWAASEPPPFIGMGGGGRGEQVEIWYWRGDRQRAADEGRAGELADVYPRMAVDIYPFAAGAAGPADAAATAGALGAAGGPERVPIAIADPRADQAPPFVAGRDVGNPVSDPELLRRPVHTLAAGGFGTLTAAATMRASGRGAWREGSYRVVFSGPLAPSAEQTQVDLRRPRLPVAIAVWNGGAGDRNGDKLVTQWFTLQMPAEVASASAAAAAPPGHQTRPARPGGRP